MTVIELLIATSILAVMTASIAGGLWAVRRAFDVDQRNTQTIETSGALQTISRVIGSAFRIPATRDSGKPLVVFDGRRDRLDFVGLSEGRSLRGGPYRIGLKLSQGDVLILFRDLSIEASEAARTAPPADVTVLRGVKAIHFAYFGKVVANGPPGWHGDWRSTEFLPELVSITLDFEDQRCNRPATFVALRQK